MSRAVKRAYQVYLQFQVFGGALRCKLFTEIFPLLTPDNSFEYAEMKAGYKPEEFATTYLREETLEYDRRISQRYEEYERLRGYVFEALNSNL